MPCISLYFDAALFNFMDIAQVGAPIAQLGAPDLFGARRKLPPLPPTSRRPGSTELDPFYVCFFGLGRCEKSVSNY